MVGPITYIRMSTLSWFWVPVIAHAIGIQQYPRLPSDQYLFNHGALFSLSELVVIVRQLLHSRMFVVGVNEWNGHQGSLFYVSADAQDRLMNTLLSTHVVGIHINTVMQQVATWFDCLWAAEVSRLAIPLGPGAQPAVAAVIAPHWVRGGNGQPVFIPSNGNLHSVWI
jgi:hypothetical protein